MDKDKYSILDEAKSVLSNREEDYGNSDVCIDMIASMWSAYLTNVYNEEVEISAKDVPMMMLLMKIVREIRNHKKDNLVDIIGYAAIYDNWMKNTDGYVEYGKES